MSEDLTSMTHAAISIAWVCAAVAVAYVAGAALSWTLQRAGRRSALITDISRFTRMPFRALFMVIATASSNSAGRRRPWKLTTPPPAAT
jgi:hypothetical protein